VLARHCHSGGDVNASALGTKKRAPNATATAPAKKLRFIVSPPVIAGTTLPAPTWHADGERIAPAPNSVGRQAIGAPERPRQQWTHL